MDASPSQPCPYHILAIFWDHVRNRLQARYTIFQPFFVKALLTAGSRKKRLIPYLARFWGIGDSSQLPYSP